jgi:hypothetical protein
LVSTHQLAARNEIKRRVGTLPAMAPSFDTLWSGDLSGATFGGAID